MSSFYEELAEWYDVLFPEESTITDYLRRDLPRRAAVLDLGCATGTYTAAVAAAGHDVTGIDLSAAMIDRARSRGRAMRAIVGDITTIPEGPYDLIYCIGNTLPHLADEKAVRSILKSIAGQLKQEGQVIIQTVNFDRPFGELPGIDRGAVVMSRAYREHPDPGHVLFTVRVTAAGETWEDATPLVALSSDRLQAAVSAAGLEIEELVGGYDGSSHTPQSFLTIVRAINPRRD